MSISSERSVLERAVALSPEDGLARLALADCLTEQGMCEYPDAVQYAGGLALAAGIDRPDLAAGFHQEHFPARKEAYRVILLGATRGRLMHYRLRSDIESMDLPRNLACSASPGSPPSACVGCWNDAYLPARPQHFAAAMLLNGKFKTWEAVVAFFAGASWERFLDGNGRSIPAAAPPRALLVRRQPMGVASRLVIQEDQIPAPGSLADSLVAAIRNGGVS